MFQKTSSAQTLELRGVTQGRLLIIAITNATSNCELQFKHGDDATWRVDPRFVGTHTAGVLVEEIIPVSATLRIVFTAPPAGSYYLSLAEEVSGD